MEPRPAEPPSVDPSPAWLPGPPALVVDPARDDLPPSPPPPRRHRVRNVVMAVVAAIALLGIGAWIGDWASRTAEMDEMVAAIESSEAAMTSSVAQVSSLVGEDTTVVPGVGDAVSQKLQQIAGQTKTEIAAAAERLQGVDVEPWHHDALAAREAYLAHSQAWQTYLGRAESDPGQWLEEEPTIESTWEALGPQLRAAVPTPAVLRLQARVDAILSDSGTSDQPAQDAAGSLPVAVGWMHTR